MSDLTQLSNLINEKNLLEKKYKSLNEFLQKCNESIDKLRKSKQYVLDGSKEIILLSDSEKFKTKSRELEDTSNEINDIIIQLEQVIIPEIQQELANTDIIIKEKEQEINTLKIGNTLL